MDLPTQFLKDLLPNSITISCGSRRRPDALTLANFAKSGPSGKDENISSARVGPSPGSTFDQKHNSPFWEGWNVIKELKTWKSYSMRRFGARAERIVFRVRGYLDGRTNLNLLGSFGNPQKVNSLADISRFFCLFIDRGLFSRF